VPLASLFNHVEVDGQYFHVVREALLPNGAIDRYSHCRDRRRRREEDGEDEEVDEKDGAPPTPPVAFAAAASATLAAAPLRGPRRPR
jgi:hypothetical protein